MPSQTRPAFYTLRTTSDQQATIYVPPDDDPWQAATKYAHTSFASDSQLAELRIATEAEIAALTAQIEGAPRAPTLPPELGSDAAPPAAVQPLRGAKLNTDRPGRGPNDHPTWASRLQQETWRSSPLVVWDQDLQRIVGLWAGEALGLLAYLHANTAWQADGIQVGPSGRFSRLDDPYWEPGTGTRDRVAFDSATAQQLFDLLQQSEQALQAMAQEEKCQAHHALGRVYSLLINAARQAQARRTQEEHAHCAEPDAQGPLASPPPTAT